MLGSPSAFTSHSVESLPGRQFSAMMEFLGLPNIWGWEDKSAETWHSPWVQFLPKQEEGEAERPTERAASLPSPLCAITANNPAWQQDVLQGVSVALVCLGGVRTLCAERPEPPPIITAERPILPQKDRRRFLRVATEKCRKYSKSSLWVLL